MDDLATKIESARCPVCGDIVIKPRFAATDDGPTSNDRPDPQVWCSEFGHWAGLLSECKVVEKEAT
jgi:hypothetical protein